MLNGSSDASRSEAQEFQILEAVRHEDARAWQRYMQKRSALPRACSRSVDFRPRPPCLHPGRGRCRIVWRAA